MYVIGIDDYRLIKVIRFDTLYDGKNIWQDPGSVEYDALLDEATIFNDHEQAKKILDYIKTEILNKGYPPTVRDICEAVKLKSTSSVHSHLETLEKNGYI